MARAYVRRPLSLEARQDSGEGEGEGGGSIRSEELSFNAAEAEKRRGGGRLKYIVVWNLRRRL